MKAQTFLITVAALCLAHAANAATWVNASGANPMNWNTGANWQGGAAPTWAADLTVDFSTLNITADKTLSLGSTGKIVGKIIFGDTTPSHSWEIVSGNGPLTLATTTGQPVIQVLDGNSTITVGLDGIKGFEKTGSAILRLNNTANPITGEILVSAGVMQIRDGTTDTPTVFAAATMNQRSLRITGTGLVDLFRTAGATKTIAWSLPAITLENGGTLRFRNGDNSAYTYNMDAALTNGTGGGVIASTGGTGSQFLNLSGAFSGSGALSFSANSGATRRLTISSADNTCSGSWTVAHTGTGTAFLRAGAANALGSGTVTLNARATLENNVANGLNSLAGVTLNETTSTLDLLSANAWNNASATLTANNGTIKLGSGASEIGAFTVNSVGTITLTGTGGSLLATDTEVQAGTLTLADGAQLTFRIGNNGVNNQLKGVGAVNLDGAFNLDVSGANTTVGNAWTLVDVANLTETFGATFTVTGFTETSPGVWKKQIDATKRYVFAEATGVLSVQANSAPMAQDIEASVAQGESLSLLVIGGKYAPTDANDDALTVTGVGTASSGMAGYTLTSVTYDATGATAGTNTFSYTVSDGFGGTDTKAVRMIVTAVTGSAPNIIGLTGTAPGNITVHFAGLPNSIFAVDRATSLPPSWTELTTTATTGTNGLGSYLDTGAPSGTGYYRTRYLSTP